MDKKGKRTKKGKKLAEDSTESGVDSPLSSKLSRLRPKSHSRRGSDATQETKDQQREQKEQQRASSKKEKIAKKEKKSSGDRTKERSGSAPSAADSNAAPRSPDAAANRQASSSIGSRLRQSAVSYGKVSATGSFKLLPQKEFNDLLSLLSEAERVSLSSTSKWMNQRVNSAPVWKAMPNQEWEDLYDMIPHRYQLLEVEFISIPADKCREFERTNVLRTMVALAERMGSEDRVRSKLHALSELHKESGNHIEAAFAMLVLAQRQPWIKPANAQASPAETSRKDAKKEKKARGKDRADKKSRDMELITSESDPCLLKEQQLLNVVDLFDKGKYWELAISVLQELRSEQRDKVMSIMELVMKERDFYLKVRHQDRFWESYFLVEAFGAVPDSLRTTAPAFVDVDIPEGEPVADFTLVFRGSEAQRLGDFVNTLKSRFANPIVLHGKFSEAQLLELNQGSASSQPAPTFIRIRTVVPSCEENVEGRERDLPENMPSNIKAFKLNTNLNVFSYTAAQVRKDPHVGPDPPKKLTELEQLQRTFVIKTFAFTVDTFPTTHRHSLVTKLISRELDPITNATHDIADKNSDLELKTERLEISAEFKSAFTMALKGIIDAAVNGGTARYTEAFLPGYSEKGLQELKQTPEKKLIDQMVRQVFLLRKGLDVHKRFCPENMIALHDTMETQFESMVKQVQNLRDFDPPVKEGDKPKAPEKAPSTAAADLLESAIARLAQHRFTPTELTSKLKRSQGSAEAVQMMLGGSSTLATSDSKAAASQKLEELRLEVRALSELRRRVESSPYGKAWQRLQGLLGMKRSALVAECEAESLTTSHSNTSMIRALWGRHLDALDVPELQKTAGLLKDMSALSLQDKNALISILLQHCGEDDSDNDAISTKLNSLTKSTRFDSKSSLAATIEFDFDDSDLFDSLATTEPATVSLPPTTATSLVSSQNDSPTVPASMPDLPELDPALGVKFLSLCDGLLLRLDDPATDKATFVQFFERVFKVFESIEILQAFEKEMNLDAVACYEALPGAVLAIDPAYPFTKQIVQAALFALKEHLHSTFFHNGELPESYQAVVTSNHVRTTLHTPTTVPTTPPSVLLAFNPPVVAPAFDPDAVAPFVAPAADVFSVPVSYSSPGATPEPATEEKSEWELLLG